jgi:predicted nucleic acid-binding Zn ribbon protein
MAKEDPQIEKFGAVLDKSLKRLQLSPRLDEYGIWPVWGEVVGKTIARNAQPERIRNGTLLVKVASPVWMQQLQYMKDMISAKLNQRVRAEVVKNIFFVVGTIDTDAPEPDAKKLGHPCEPLDVKIDDDFLASVPDAEIRQAFASLMKSHLRRKRRA